MNGLLVLFVTLSAASALSFRGDLYSPVSDFLESGLEPGYRGIARRQSGAPPTNGQSTGTSVPVVPGSTSAPVVPGSTPATVVPGSTAAPVVPGSTTAPVVPADTPAPVVPPSTPVPVVPVGTPSAVLLGTPPSSQAGNPTTGAVDAPQGLGAKNQATSGTQSKDQKKQERIAILTKRIEHLKARLANLESEMQKLKNSPSTEGKPSKEDSKKPPKSKKPTSTMNAQPSTESPVPSDPTVPTGPTVQSVSTLSGSTPPAAGSIKSSTDGNVEKGGKDSKEAVKAPTLAGTAAMPASSPKP